MSLSMKWLTSLFFQSVCYTLYQLFGISERGLMNKTLCLQWTNCTLHIACLYWFLPLDLKPLTSSDNSYSPSPMCPTQCLTIQALSLWIYLICFCFWHSELKILGYCSIIVEICIIGLHRMKPKFWQLILSDISSCA